MNFAEAAKLAAKFTRTENGAVEQQVPFAARIRSGSPAFSPRPTRKIRFSRQRSHSMQEMSEADWVKDRPSVRSCSLWQNIIRRHFV